MQGKERRVENVHHVDDRQALAGQQSRRAFVRADVGRTTLPTELSGVWSAVSGTTGGGGGEERSKGAETKMADNASESSQAHTLPRTGTTAADSKPVTASQLCTRECLP